MNMYPSERREALRLLIARQGFASIPELADKFDVSEITIRRDLKVLQQKGLVEKVVGGGQATRHTQEMNFVNKRVIQQGEKRAIAEAALSLLDSGMTVGISAGTTTWTLAQAIDGRWDNLTFVTNSTNVAVELQVSGWDDIHLTGGQFRTPSDALVGPLAEESAQKLYTDILFLGVHGIDLDFGATSPNLLEASLNRVMISRTQKVVLLFDHTKWGVRGLAQLADFSEIDAVVTDDADGVLEIDAIRDLGVDVLVGSVPTSEHQGGNVHE